MCGVKKVNCTKENIVLNTELRQRIRIRQYLPLHKPLPIMVKKLPLQKAANNFFKNNDRALRKYLSSNTRTQRKDETALNKLYDELIAHWRPSSCIKHRI